MASVIWEDFLRHFRPFKNNNGANFISEEEEEKRVQITRSLSTTLAVVIVVLAYAASAFEDRFDVAAVGIEAVGICVGPILAVFLLGFFTFTANKIVSAIMRCDSALFHSFTCSAEQVYNWLALFFLSWN